MKITINISNNQGNITNSDILKNLFPKDFMRLKTLIQLNSSSHLPDNWLNKSYQDTGEEPIKVKDDKNPLQLVCTIGEFDIYGQPNNYSVIVRKEDTTMPVAYINNTTLEVQEIKGVELNTIEKEQIQNEFIGIIQNKKDVLGIDNNEVDIEL